MCMGAQMKAARARQELLPIGQVAPTVAEPTVAQAGPAGWSMSRAAPRVVVATRNSSSDCARGKEKSEQHAATR